MGVEWNSQFSVRIRQAFGLFSLTKFEAQLIDRVRREMSCAAREALDSQMSEFNQTDRLLGSHRGQSPPFGHTSFYKNVFGKSVRKFRSRLPVEDGVHRIACLEVLEPGNKIRVDFIAVDGVFFTMKYFSKGKRFVPSESFEVEVISIAQELRG